MPDREFQERIWSVLSEHRICMITTIRNGSIVTRPMSGHLDRDNHRILFVTRRSNAAADNQEASLAISDEDDNFYATIACTTAELEDRDLLRQLWSPVTGAWFPDGPDDPEVTILALEPLSAEIWNGPSSGVLIAFKLAAAKMLGRPPDLGINTTIDMRDDA